MFPLGGYKIEISNSIRNLEVAQSDQLLEVAQSDQLSPGKYIEIIVAAAYGIRISRSRYEELLKFAERQRRSDFFPFV